MRSELTVYPAIFTFDGKYYNVDFIDLKGCSTYGDSIQNAYYMAQDAMGLFLDELVNFPNPTLDISNIKLEKNQKNSENNLNNEINNDEKLDENNVINIEEFKNKEKKE